MTSDDNPVTERYDPRSHTMMTFHDLVPSFRAGSDTPRALIERCLEAIAAREDEIMAWEVIDEAAARASADASSARYQAGRPLSVIDGLPVGIKDLIETADIRPSSAAYCSPATGRCRMRPASMPCAKAARWSLARPSP